MLKKSHIDNKNNYNNKLNQSTEKPCCFRKYNINQKILVKEKVFETC